jgi:hypothetical protein
LIRLPGGAGVVRLVDGATVVTGDVDEGRGAFLREEDPYQPANSWVDGQGSLVGGLLPPGAVSVEVIDDRGMRVAAAIGDGAYAAILAHPNDGYDPIVCCRDGASVPVCRPLPAEYPSVRVTDAMEPCPACGTGRLRRARPLRAVAGRARRAG